jgi:glycine cleavage system H protein
MQTPADLKYTKTDEWVRLEGGVAIIGITDYAQEQLSDVVFVEVPYSIGDSVTKGSRCATVESVKAAADVNFPVSGKLAEINENLSGTPEVLNTDPFGQAWICKVTMTDPTELGDLMDAEAYIQYCEGRH